MIKGQRDCEIWNSDDCFVSPSGGAAQAEPCDYLEISLIIDKHGRKEGRKGHSTMETQKGSLNLRALYEDGKTLNNVKLSKMDK